MSITGRLIFDEFLSGIRAEKDDGLE